MKTLKIFKKPGMILLPVLVQPRANINRVVGLHNGSLKIRVAAPPIQGRANLELLNFLASLLELHTRYLCLIRGPKSKYKSIGIRGLTQKQVVERLSRHLMQ